MNNAGIADSPQRRRGKWSTRLVIAFFVLLASMPLASTLKRQLDKEIARWYWAAAINSRQSKDLAGASRSIDNALRFDPGNPKLLIEQAELLRQLKDKKRALEILQQLSDLPPSLEFARARVLLRLDERKLALEKLMALKELGPRQLNERLYLLFNAGANEAALADLNALLEIEGLTTAARERFSSMKATLLFRMNRVKPAIEILTAAIEQAKERSEYEYADALNNLAYHRSIANVELGKALRDINIALKVGKPAARSAYLDTRGWIYFRAKKYEDALVDMEEAVKLARKQLKIAPTDDDLVAESNKRHLAVMLKHRALVYRVLQQAANEERDRAEVRKLGFDPDDKDLQ